MTATKGLRELLPAEFSQHPYHRGERAFAETNCYVDLWIAMLHALGLEPEACLGFGLASAFEGDQWTFVKPSHGDLARLYGISVEELSLWRPLQLHIAEQVARGCVPLVEMDAYYLPDTQATDYRRAHVKTTVGVTHIDASQRRLRYFHNAGFYELAGDDFDGLFRLDRPTPEDHLPPFAELVRVSHAVRREPNELRALATELTRHHHACRPRSNPLKAYGDRFTEHMAWVAAGGEDVYHRYSFATLRQLGAAFEVAAAHLRWLDTGERPALSEAAVALEVIPVVAKRVMLKLSRVAHTQRPADMSAAFHEMADAWDRGMERAAVGLAA